jgi:hypothetical protein
MAIPRFQGTDEQAIRGIMKDASLGINSRTNVADLQDGQFAVLYNVDISIPGQTTCRPGSVLIGNDVGAASPLCLHNYEIQGDDDQLLMYEDTDVHKWEGSGNWASLKSDFTAGATEVGMCSVKESGLAPDDVVIVQNDVAADHAFRLASDGTWEDLGVNTGASASPPKSTVMCWYANRLWVLKDDLLYFSDAYPSTYSTAFDTTSGSFRVPVGDQMGLIPTRDTGIIVMGAKEIWGLAPSIIPDPTADKPQPQITNHGVVSKKGFVNAGDDIYYFARDGFRSMKRTQQDKLSGGPELPISFWLKDEYESIAWPYISGLSMEYFDSKVFIAVPTGVSTFDTWIYYPASNAFTVMTGVNPKCWAKYKVSSEERLYYGKTGDGKVYRAWTGYNDEGTTVANGTAISYEESKSHDGGFPMIKKTGGELTIRAEASGSLNLGIYANFDNGGWNLLGTLNLGGNLLTFPGTFPMVFLSPTKAYKKFHLDRYGSFYNVQIKITHNAQKSNDITILERILSTYPTEYIAEEDSES